MTEWVMVPREPKEAMIRAGYSAPTVFGVRDMGNIYRAMLDAAPVPTADDCESVCDAYAAENQQFSDELARLRAEVEALKAENAALASWQCLFTDGTTGLYHDGCGNAQCARDHLVVHLTAEVEALRADAERYRWLRDVGDGNWRPMADRVPGGATVIDASIDDAINAAMSATAQLAR